MQVYNYEKNHGSEATKTKSVLESLPSAEANMQLFSVAAIVAVFLALIGETSAATMRTEVRKVDPRAGMLIAKHPEAAV